MTAGKDRSDDGVLLKSYWNGVPSDSVSEAIIIAERMERNDPIIVNDRSQMSLRQMTEGS